MKSRDELPPLTQEVIDEIVEDEKNKKDAGVEYLKRLVNATFGSQKRTKSEQARAEAKVQAAVKAAKNRPRKNTPKAERRQEPVLRAVPDPVILTTMMGHRPRPPKRRRR